MIAKKVRAFSFNNILNELHIYYQSNKITSIGLLLYITSIKINYCLLDLIQEIIWKPVSKDRARCAARASRIRFFIFDLTFLLLHYSIKFCFHPLFLLF